MAPDLAGSAPGLPRRFAACNAGLADIPAAEGTRLVVDLTDLAVDSQSSLSREPDGLEAAGVIRPEPNACDGRIRRHDPTPAAGLKCAPPRITCSPG